MRRLGFAVAALSLLAAGGCVTRGAHGRVVAERDALSAAKKDLTQRVRLLEASNGSLSEERLELIDQLEDLRQARDALGSEARGLRESRDQLLSRRDELAERLQLREAELAAKGEKLEKLHTTYEALVGDLEAELAAGQIQIEQLREGIRVNLSDQILFPSGSAELSVQGERILTRMAQQVREGPYRIEVQGHTDDVGIRGGLAKRYPTNWELAGARAARVVRLLEKAGVAPTRLEAISLGEYRPVAPNDTPDGRARNRRIEIRLIPTGTAKADPVRAPSDPAPPAGP